MKQNPVLRLIKEASRQSRSEGDADQPSPLSLEQRTVILLRALHGREDFSNEEYRAARGKLLKKMAGDALRDNAEHANPKVALPDRPEIGLSAERQHLWSPVELARRPVMAARHAKSLSGDASFEPLFSVGPTKTISDSSDLPPSAHAVVSSSAAQPGRSQRSFAGTTRSRLIIGGSFAAFASLIVAFAVLSNFSQLSSPTSKPDMVAQFDPHKTLPLQTDKLQVSAPIDSMGVEFRLFAIGTRLLDQGDTENGRDVLIEATKSGSAAAAFKLGQMFDPTEITANSDKKLLKDLSVARHWYARAVELGSQEAKARLERLGPR